MSDFVDGVDHLDEYLATYLLSIRKNDDDEYEPVTLRSIVGSIDGNFKEQRETGAGKTSFINLLLGERLLPTSLLSNTHTICELSNSPSDNLDADVEYVDKPREEGVKTFLNKDNPNEFNNVVIVDSPGVGETQEMTDVVLGYVEKAAAFIFVIDMMNAGGVQQRVPTKEKKIVINDTVERLLELWPELDSSQILPFSTTEAQSFQDEGAVAPRFKTVLARLSHLIPAAQFMTTHKAQTLV
ncbi:hypothetical protein DPMN_040741 [Dreissena polymorpha]|uniref:Dynamin N-terminal domain-containing protein n=1 Tax=Dreissena polymorpha TaxID=45954 RepID=A0A9D4HVB9_DREPO|nr:hypothetical protein DPMN_040741 [Dreissena polymorpha]